MAAFYVSCQTKDSPLALHSQPKSPAPSNAASSCKDFCVFSSMGAILQQFIPCGVHNQASQPDVEPLSGLTKELLYAIPSHTHGLTITQVPSLCLHHSGMLYKWNRPICDTCEKLFSFIARKTGFPFWHWSFLTVRLSWLGFFFFKLGRINFIFRSCRVSSFLRTSENPKKLWR